MSSDYLDVDCETRPDLKGQVEKLTVRDGLNRGFHVAFCDNPAEMRKWHRVIFSAPYHDPDHTLHKVYNFLHEHDHPDDSVLVMGKRWLYEPVSTRTQLVPMGNQIVVMPVIEPTIQDHEWYIRDADLVMQVIMLWPNTKVWWGQDYQIKDTYSDLFE